MYNIRSLRPAVRALLAVATTSAGVMAVPAAGAVAATPTLSTVSAVSTPAVSTS